MGKFSSSKNGYDKKEVDEYLFNFGVEYENKLREQKMHINDLKRELSETKEQLDAFKQKNSNISDALVVAVETAKQIESSSKNIYELEIKRIRSLYDKWKNFLDELMKKYPASSAKYDTKKLLKVFSDDINGILNQNKKSIEQKEVVATQSTDALATNTLGLRMLINKMSNANRPILPNMTMPQKADAPIIRNPKPSDETLDNYTNAPERQTKSSNFEEHRVEPKDQIKPITDMKLDGADNYENLVDKFLTSDDEEYQNNAYSKLLLEKQKNEAFNLKDAVTPTEDLDEIMRSFSFYPENDKD
ncbi:MAG: DivIVA domain-containing protein [Clostridia bacterium]|nr:DivIVA domain-containing protein [Clostridia bacterium]